MYKQTIILTIINIFSKISILLRESFIAAWCGTNIVSDMLHISFNMLSVLRRFMGENNITQLLWSFLSKESKNRVNFINNTTTILSIISVVITFIIILIIPYLMYFFKGFKNTVYEPQLILLVRIHVIYFIFIIMGASFIALLNYYEKFIYFSIMPIIYNVSIICGAKLLHSFMHIRFAIIISAIIGGIIQIIFIISIAHSMNHKIGLTIPKWNKQIKQFLYKLSPDISAGVLEQLGTIFYYGLYSQIIGVIAMIQYAARIWQIPFAIVVNVLNILLFAKLSKTFQEYEKSIIIQNRTINIILLVSIPITCFLICIANPLIKIIYFRGNFLISDVIKVSHIFTIGVISLPAMMLNKIFRSIFYINHDTSSTSLIKIFVTIIDIILAYYCLEQFAYLGLVIVIVFNHYLTFILLLAVAQYKKYTKFQYKFMKLIKILFASIMTYIITFYILSIFNPFYLSKIYTMLILILMLCIAIISYILILYIVRVITWKDISNN